ncbi:MAG: hypothetical protein KIT31_01335 [Deltaproteobacteria bacterium]|nr:hypothetical protein [Deltaproteobacteria bacterium]
MAEQIKTKDEFVAFAKALLDNHAQHQEEWENTSLESFLRALASFAEHSEGYYANIGMAEDPTPASWRTFADFLLAARIYE